MVGKAPGTLFNEPSSMSDPGSESNVKFAVIVTLSPVLRFATGNRLAVVVPVIVTSPWELGPLLDISPFPVWYTFCCPEP